MKPFTQVFSIKFTYEDTDYSAEVRRFDLKPVRYLALIDQPENSRKYLPYIFKGNAHGKITYNLKADDNEFLECMEMAIYNYCILENIQFV